MAFEEFETPVVYSQDNVMSLGVKQKIGKCQVPLLVCEEIQLGNALEIHGTENPIKDAVMYLKSLNSSKKQKAEILNRECLDLKVKFSCTRTYKLENKKYLTFKVNSMSKLNEQSHAPEDC